MRPATVIHERLEEEQHWVLGLGWKRGGVGVQKEEDAEERGRTGGERNLKTTTDGD
jgi:hypothetical protein